MNDSTPTDASQQSYERASLRRNATQMVSSQLFTWALAMLITVVVPRYLGPASVGQLRLVTSFWTIALIFIALGMSRFVRLQVARDAAGGLALVGPVVVLRLLTFVAALVLLVVYAGVVVGDRTVVVLTLIVGAGSLCGTLTSAMEDAFVGLERMAVPALIQALGRLLNFAGVMLVVVVGGNLYGIGGAGAIAAAIALGYMYIRFRSIASLDFAHWRADARPIVRGSLPFLAASGALVVYQQIDVIVISWVAGDADIGWYGTADAVFGSLVFPATILMVSAFPTIGRLTVDDEPAMRALVARTFSLLVLAAVPIGFGTTLIAPSFAPVLFGDDFHETGTVLAILGPVLIATFATTLLGTVALATERSRTWVTLLVAMAALTVVLDLVLVPWASERFDNGAIGGAIAYCVTETIQVVVGLILIAPYLLRRSVAWQFVRTVAAGAAMFAVGWPLRSSLVVLPIGVCAVVYAVLVWALRIPTPEQWDLLNPLTRRLRRRPADHDG